MAKRAKGSSDRRSASGKPLAKPGVQWSVLDAVARNLDGPSISVRCGAVKFISPARSGGKMLPGIPGACESAPISWR